MDEKDSKAPYSSTKLQKKQTRNINIAKRCWKSERRSSKTIMDDCWFELKASQHNKLKRLARQ
jgi:hypothetical protein